MLQPNSLPTLAYRSASSAEPISVTRLGAWPERRSTSCHSAPINSPDRYSRACVAGNRQGEIFNVNADQMAVSAAVGFDATRLCFLTDVPGVKRADGAVIDVLTAAAARALIAEGVATGGMEAKLVSACEALSGGVESVTIAPGATPGILAQLLRGEACGTRMVSQ